MSAEEVKPAAVHAASSTVAGVASSIVADDSPAYTATVTLKDRYGPRQVAALILYLI